MKSTAVILHELQLLMLHGRISSVARRWSITSRVTSSHFSKWKFLATCQSIEHISAHQISANSLRATLPIWEPSPSLQHNFQVQQRPRHKKRCRQKRVFAKANTSTDCKTRAANAAMVKASISRMRRREKACSFNGHCKLHVSNYNESQIAVRGHAYDYSDMQDCKVKSHLLRLWWRCWILGLSANNSDKSCGKVHHKQEQYTKTCL